MQISKILLPVDGSSYSDNAIDYTVYLAGLTGAHVTVVSCYEWLNEFPEISESVMEKMQENLRFQAETVLRSAAEKLAEKNIAHEAKSIAGAPGSMLSNLAKSKAFDLIIMGSHGHSDISGLFLGSVTHKVLNTIYCPVLVVPEIA